MYSLLTLTRQRLQEAHEIRSLPNNVAEATHTNGHGQVENLPRVAEVSPSSFFLHPHLILPLFQTQPRHMHDAAEGGSPLDVEVCSLANFSDY